MRSHGWVKDIVNDEYRNDENFPFIFHESVLIFVQPIYERFIGLGQLDKANDIFTKRNKNHMRYVEKIGEKFELQDCQNTTATKFTHRYSCQSNEHRKRVIQKCNENGIETRVWSHGNLGRHKFWTSRYGEFEGKIG